MKENSSLNSINLIQEGKTHFSHETIAKSNKTVTFQATRFNKILIRLERFQ